MAAMETAARAAAVEEQETAHENAVAAVATATAAPPTTPGLVATTAAGAAGAAVDAVDPSLDCAALVEDAAGAAPDAAAGRSGAGRRRRRELVPGTTWAVVQADDGRIFYYDRATRRSVWREPDEVKAARKQQRKRARDQDDEHDAWLASTAMAAGPAAASAPTGVQPPVPLQPMLPMLPVPMMPPLMMPPLMMPPPMMPLPMLLLAPPPLPPPPMATTATVMQQGPTAADGPAQTSQTESDEGADDADVDATLAAQMAAAEAELAQMVHKQRDDTQTPAQRVAAFRAMLEECGVSAFDTWDRAVPKIFRDERYTLLPARDRIAVFEAWAAERAARERAERESAVQQAQRAYAELLSEAALSPTSSYRCAAVPRPAGAGTGAR